MDLTDAEQAKHERIFKTVEASVSKAINEAITDRANPASVEEVMGALSQVLAYHSGLMIAGAVTLGHCPESRCFEAIGKASRALQYGAMIRRPAGEQRFSFDWNAFLRETTNRGETNG